MKAINQASILTAAAILTACGGGVGSDSAASDLSLQSQELALDNNCAPGFLKRSFLRAAPVAASKFFWSGQRYAVDREVQNQMQALRALRIDDYAQKQITAIEIQRDRALGIPQQAVGPELSKALAEADEQRKRFEQDMVASTQAWAAKCKRVIDENLLPIENRK